MAEERDMTVEAFASELLELGLLSMKSNWPKLSNLSTVDTCHSLSIDVE